MISTIPQIADRHKAKGTSCGSSCFKAWLGSFKTSYGDRLIPFHFMDDTNILVRAGKRAHPSPLTPPPPHVAGSPTRNDIQQIAGL